MKKLILLSMILFMLILSACNIPEKVTQEMMRTFVASTLQARINEIGSLTPPTPTATETPIPSDTPMPTLTPTPTIEPTPTWTYHEGKADILALYYHDVVKDRHDDAYYQWEFDYWYVKPLEFEQQMRMLSELGYTSITIDDVVKVLTGGGELPPRPVFISFDSTELGQWKNAYPTMKKYGLVGNLFVNSNHVITGDVPSSQKNSLTKEQINELLDNGWGIGSSGNDYQDTGLRLADHVRYNLEISESKRRLEEIFPGLEIKAFSYPDGYTDPNGEIIRRVSNVYKIAFCRVHPANYELSSDQRWFLPRYEISGGMSYNDFLALLPWKEGTISQETMEWTLPKPTVTK